MRRHILYSLAMVVLPLWLFYVGGVDTFLLTTSDLLRKSSVGPDIPNWFTIIDFSGEKPRVVSAYEFRHEVDGLMNNHSLVPPEKTGSGPRYRYTIEDTASGVTRVRLETFGSTANYIFWYDVSEQGWAPRYFKRYGWPDAVVATGVGALCALLGALWIGRSWIQRGSTGSRGGKLAGPN